MSVAPINETVNASAGEEICCPKFDPSLFEEDGHSYKTITWDEKPFVKDGTYCFFYVPLAFGQAMTRAMKKIEAAGAETPKEDFMVLSDCHSLWYSNIFLSIAKDKEVKGAKIEKISGKFLCKAFEGDYSNMGTWAKEMQVLVSDVLEKEGYGYDTNSVDVEKLKMYFYYPTCPKCAKRHGKNHVVIMANIA